MSARLSTRPLAILALAVALPLSGLAVPPASAADAAPIPEAPVLSVIAKTETLPFTLDGGGPIDVAVLTGDQLTADPSTVASWNQIDELALAPYNGQTIRVLARAHGVTDAADYFDATYAVRDTYPPAWDLGTTDNPTGAIRANDTRFRGWATGWTNLKRGPNVSGGWLERPVDDFLGEVAVSNDSVNGATTHLVVLGDKGEITATFGSPVTDGAGADFAVFENGFRILGGTLDFAELAYVEVSSDGEHFVRFDSATTRTDSVGAFAGVPASDFGGVAGQYWTGYGTGFDLATLKNQPAVREGLVDLDAITHIKVRDIAGCGEDLDSFGRPIYDPCGTAQSGGFDLTGIGVLNQADDIAWIDVPKLGSVGPKSATITSKVTANGQLQNVRAEFSSHADHSDVTASAPFQVRATQRSRPVSFTLDGLHRGSTYYYRLVSEGANGRTTASSWQHFVAPDILIDDVRAETAKQVIDAGVVHVPFLFTVKPSGSSDFTVRVEYSANSDHSGGILTHPKSVSGRFAWPIQISEFLMDLQPDWDYSARVVATGSDGTVTTSPWVDFHLNSTSSYRLEPVLGSNVEAGFSGGVLTACTYVSAAPDADGLRLALYGYDYGTSTEVTGERVPVELVNGGAYSCAELTGVDPSNAYLALRLSDSSGEVLTATGVTAPSGNPTATPTVPVVSDVTATGATFAGSVEVGQTGSQSVFFEYAPATDPGAVRSTPDAWVASSWSDSSTVTGLVPGTDYQVRTVAAERHGTGVVTSDWAPFTTAGQAAQLTTVSVSALGWRSATVTVSVVPGNLPQQLWVEYGSGDGTDSASTAKTEVPAGLDLATAAFDLDGLAPNTRFSYRALVRPATGGEIVAGAWSTFMTAGVSDPSVEIAVSPTSAKVGETVTVSWKTTDATTVMATGSWSGDKALSGSEKVKVTTPGSWNFGITATGEAGNTTTATAAATATLPAQKLAVSTQKAVTAPGKSLTVKATGMTAGETYAITISGIRAATGKATPTGTVSTSVAVPKVLGAGIHTVTVTGSTADRTGSTTTRLVPTSKKLTVKTTSKVKRGKKVTIKTSGLGAYEPITITIGTTRKTATATSKGTLSVKVTVPKNTRTGKTTIRLTGLTPGRTGTKTIKITR